jgi:hypothetical protein
MKDKDSIQDHLNAMKLQDHNTINELIKFYQKNRSEADYKKGIQPIDGHKIDSLMMSNYLRGSKLDLNIY